MAIIRLEMEEVMIKQYRPRKKHERFKAFLVGGKLDGMPHAGNPFEVDEMSKSKKEVTAISDRFDGFFIFKVTDKVWRFEKCAKWA